MLKNYLKIAFRSLNRNKTYAVINILGLALGLGVTILVFLFVKYETSYDKQWDGYDRIHRMGIKANKDENGISINITAPKAEGGQLYAVTVRVDGDLKGAGAALAVACEIINES